MVSHNPFKFGSPRHFGRVDMFFMVEGQDSTCPCFDLPLLFISKGHGLKAQDISY